MLKYRLKNAVIDIEAMFFPDIGHPKFETQGFEIQDWINRSVGQASAGWEDECLQVDYRDREQSTYIPPGRWVVIFAGRVLDFSTEGFMAMVDADSPTTAEVSRG